MRTYDSNALKGLNKARNVQYFWMLFCTDFFFLLQRAVKAHPPPTQIKIRQSSNVLMEMLFIRLEK